MDKNIWQIVYNRVKWLFLLILLILPTSVFGGWSIQETVVETSWGNLPGQVGVSIGDTIAYDDFPNYFGVTFDGKVVIADTINGRLEIFNSDGSYLLSISSPLQWDGWPYSVVVNGSNCAVVGYAEMTHTFSTTNGSLIGVAQNMGGVDYVNSDCSKIYSETKDGWKIYTPTGQLLSTSPTRPLELGRWSWRCLEGVKTEEKCFKHHIEIEYPDAVYVYEVTKPLFKSNLKDQVRINDNLIMDNKGYDEDCVYAYSVTATVMPDGATKPLRWLGYVTKWERPQGEYGTEIVGVEKLDVLIKEYGSPVIGPDGSIYTWMRTPTHYKILRWRWVP
jgi:hypothetical protein